MQHPLPRQRMAMESAQGTSSVCAACRVLRRKCTAQCLFAPYFPPDQPQKFAHVHKWVDVVIED
ncbi:hypothetical protein M758_4G255800 [Ceratodon purpureus]|nr:hypothetical protein M758_4G255800 [Ceratodon purpureus]